MADIPRTAEELFNPESVETDNLDTLLDRSNAADAPRLKRKAAADKTKELDDEADLREVLSIPGGVRFLARLLEHCHWGQEHFHPSNSVMCYAAGRRSLCRDLENWISDADLELWLRVRRQLELKRPKPKTSQKRQPATP